MAIAVLALLPCLAVAATPAILRPIFVSPQWLAERRAEYQVLHVGWGPEQGDIKVVEGATYLNTDEIEFDFLNESTQGPEAEAAKEIKAELPQNFWRLYPDEYLLRALAFAGVGVRSRIVVYSPDVLGGARAAWAMLMAGVKDVRLLDGGSEAWQRDGYPVASATALRRPLEHGFGVHRALRPRLSADPREVRHLARLAANGSVVDTRMRCEFEGTCAPYSYIPTAGRVAGAVWAGGGDTDQYHMESYFINGTLRPLSCVSARWAKLGVCPLASRRCTFYCGAGWRSGLATLFGLELGRDESANFDGGWYVYSMGPQASVDPTMAPSFSI